MKVTGWEVQMQTCDGEWENCSSSGGVLNIFHTQHLAQQDLDEFIDDMDAACAAGDIDDFDPEDYRVQEVTYVKI